MKCVPAAGCKKTEAARSLVCVKLLRGTKDLGMGGRHRKRSYFCALHLIDPNANVKITKAGGAEFQFHELHDDPVFNGTADYFKPEWRNTAEVVAAVLGPACRRAAEVHGVDWGSDWTDADAIEQEQGRKRRRARVSLAKAEKDGVAALAAEHPGSAPRHAAPPA